MAIVNLDLDSRERLQRPRQAEPLFGPIDVLSRNEKQAFEARSQVFSKMSQMFSIDQDSRSRRTGGGACGLLIRPLRSSFEARSVDPDTPTDTTVTLDRQDAKILQPAKRR